jgi:hypothetical protein
MVQKQTKTHKLVDITKEIIDKKLCEPCNSKNKSINAIYICDDCDENRAITGVKSLDILWDVDFFMDVCCSAHDSQYGSGSSQSRQ